MTRLTPDLVDRLAGRGSRIVVIGDLILDGWWAGQAERMSREAPAPVVEITEREFAPGGAANTAVNLAAMGARVAIIGVIGEDEAGARLRSLLEAAGVDTTGLVRTAATQTIAKNRILSDDHVFVRLDEVNHAEYPPQVGKAIVDAAQRLSTWAQVEVICDYGCGVFTPDVITRLAARSPRPRPCIVDSHDLRRTAPLQPDLITPNFQEFTGLCGPVDTEDRAGGARALRARLLERSGSRAAIVTLDREGAILLPTTGEPHRTYAKPAKERQASGAGDTFTAGLALARAADLELPLATELAQLAADIVVRREGTAVCSATDLRAELSGGEGITPPEALRAAVTAHRQQGQRIVFTNGCFDVVHTGHISSLRQAKRHGDVLVVAINDDESVRQLKGPGRPVNAAADRAAVLDALSYVDYVTVFSGSTPIPLLQLLQPEVYAKGGDYVPEMLAETEIVRGYGGAVQILDYVSTQSTSGIVDQIREGKPALTPRRIA